MQVTCPAVPIENIVACAVRCQCQSGCKPGQQAPWSTLSKCKGVHQVLGEDLVLVAGQQDRMQRGADTWAHPVAYDKLAIRCAPGSADSAGGSVRRASISKHATEECRDTSRTCAVAGRLRAWPSGVIGHRYRRWRNTVGAEEVPAQAADGAVQMSAGELFQVSIRNLRRLRFVGFFVQRNVALSHRMSRCSSDCEMQVCAGLLVNGRLIKCHFGLVVSGGERAVRHGVRCRGGIEQLLHLRLREGPFQEGHVAGLQSFGVGVPRDPHSSNDSAMGIATVDDFAI